MARFPIYQRILVELRRNGVAVASSDQLARLARVNAATVRKDLSFLGTFGTRGTGYNPSLLIGQIDRALGADRDWSVVVVGAGNLGRALAGSEGFSAHGFRVAALFDVDPDVVGAEAAGLVVRHLDHLGDLSPDDLPAVGVVATPAGAAQEVVDALVAVGARSILNFAPRVLTVPPHVLLRYVDLSIELQVMSFHLARQAEGSPDVGPLGSAGVPPGPPAADAAPPAAGAARAGPAARADRNRGSGGY